MNSSNFFIAIGPPKTGTTWLYKNLKKHPDISLPKVKEIRYFWAKEFLDDTLKNRLLNNNWYYRRKRELIISFFKSHIRYLKNQKSINWSELKWDLKFFFSKHNDTWYKNLFDSNKLTGDITPMYCELSEDSIRELKTMFPDCKIIISLRDPIERQWSRARMNLIENRDNHHIYEVSKDRVLTQFTDELQHQSNDYVNLIKKWEKYFSKDNILVYHFDELKNDPESLFNKICDFLNVEKISVPGLKAKHKKGLEHPIPQEYLDILVELNIDFIKKYSTFENHYSKLWLKKYT